MGSSVDGGVYLPPPPLPVPEIEAAQLPEGKDLPQEGWEHEVPASELELVDNPPLTLEQRQVLLDMAQEEGIDVSSLPNVERRDITQGHGPSQRTYEWFVAVEPSIVEIKDPAKR